ncbi:MAG: outer membrane protein [Spirochaetota bacterium]
MNMLSRWTAVVLLPAFILLFSLSIFAHQWDSSVAEKGVNGIANVASSIIADSFVPMTHYNQGELTATLVPAYFDIQKAYDDPDVEGKDLTGYSLGLGAGYALTDRWMLYGILAHMRIKGDMTGNFYPEAAPSEEVTVGTDYSLTALYGGAGFDLLGDNSNFSIPVYAGLFVERYNASLSLPEEPVSASLKPKADGSGFLTGGSIAIAFSMKIMEMFKVTPYYLYSRSFNKPEINAKVDLPFPFGTVSQTMKMDPVSVGMAGLALTWMTTDAFSISISMGGWLTSASSWYNDRFLNGLEMKSVVVALSYTK